MEVKRGHTVNEKHDDDFNVQVHSEKVTEDRKKNKDEETDEESWFRSGGFWWYRMRWFNVL